MQASISPDPIYHSINYQCYYFLFWNLSNSYGALTGRKKIHNLLGETQALCKYKKWSPWNAPYYNFKEHEFIICIASLHCFICSLQKEQMLGFHTQQRNRDDNDNNALLIGNICSIVDKYCNGIIVCLSVLINLIVNLVHFQLHMHTLYFASG